VALFKRRKGLGGDGIAGTGVIRSCERETESAGIGQGEVVRLADTGIIGKHKWDLTLEVTLEDGRDPYSVTGTYKVPSKLLHWISEGRSVPLRADPEDPHRVELDWDRFDTSGPSEREAGAAADERRAETHEAMPAGNRNLMVEGWLMAFKAGGMTRAQLDESLAGAVEAGMLTSEEADAARRSAG
jgi:hypothetical protein